LQLHEAPDRRYANNAITDIRVLRGDEREGLVGYFDAPNDNYVSDVTASCGLTHLTTLLLGDNPIKDILTRGIRPNLTDCDFEPESGLSDCVQRRGA
jgi:hypothetical protein